MPIEVNLLAAKPVPFDECPFCQLKPFVPFLRGMIQRQKHSWWGLGKPQAYCAVICEGCKKIVGYESP